MFEGVPWPAVTAAGGGWLLFGLSAFAIIRAFMRGEVVPKSTHERELEDIVHDRNEWRAAHRISETARQVATDQTTELLEHARTTDAFIRALPHPSEREEAK